MVVEFGVIQAEKLAGKMSKVLVDARCGERRQSGNRGIRYPVFLWTAGRRQPDRNPLQFNQLPEPPRRLEPDAACLDFQGASLARFLSMTRLRRHSCSKFALPRLMRLRPPSAI